ncbi:hypothetical protein DTO006G1_7784 [Penicillium roqueforti]|nr:hypothetical protein CBS147337_4929 [Penicillium roqueforti]KAI2670472.1 hypothetical protein CBS147355_9197 [Penicillium roqueforti]KAI2757388.1 hypothetical protein DTO006G1_7784 [Penicillium roqueforti]KAI3137394.1 hypothetical protein CBS147326_3643 [Penicillium roqueforti]KAI3180345.1 hypothetical protein DTO046C5_1581 [Penicillium roqueforti]
MIRTATTLSQAINELRAARGNISSPQFYQLIHEQDARLPSVRLSLLNASEVEYILCLEPAKTNQGLDSFPTIAPPELLIKNLAMTDDALKNEKNAEASMRWRMNHFLLFAFNTAMDTYSEEKRLLEIHCEPRWSFGPVRYKDQAVKLSGYPSYALWYGNEDEAALNVIVAQNTRFKRHDKGIPEVLGYMGFVHHHRKNANKLNSPVYGVATDSKTFHFVRLDNNSTFITATLDSEVDLEKVFSLLVHILKEALIVQSTQPKEPSMQSNQGEGSVDPLVPVGSSLRRKVAKETQYEKLKVAAAALDEDLDYYDIDVRDLELEFPEDETSEDEYSEDD